MIATLRLETAPQLETTSELLENSIRVVLFGNLSHPRKACAISVGRERVLRNTGIVQENEGVVQTDLRGIRLDPNDHFLCKILDSSVVFRIGPVGKNQRHYFRV